MSKPVNPMAIGGFVLGGLALFIAGIFVFGGTGFFKPKAQYVVYFDSSLNGLMAGAPVSMQGVQIGTVKYIDIMLDSETTTVLKPVVIELDFGTVHGLRGGELKPAFSREKRRQNLQKLIDAGLRARLEMQSFLTGRLYVDLNFYPGESVHLVGREHEGRMEIPSMPTRTEELRNTLDEAARQFRKIPFDKILGDLTATLEHVREFTGSEDLKAARRELASALQGARALTERLNQKVDPLTNGFLSSTTELRGLIRDFRQEMKPLVKNTDSALAMAQKALTTADESMKKLQGTLDSAETFTAPDSNLDQAIVELRETARAVRDLADYLERNPNSVIFGKP